MRTPFTIALALLLFLGLAPGLVPDLSAQPNQQVSIDLDWISRLGETRLDSAKASLTVGTADTSDWVRVPDSSAQGGGIALTIWSNEDSCLAKIQVEWAIKDLNTDTYRIHRVVTTLDSLVGAGNIYSTRNPSMQSIYYWKPRGAEWVRVIVTSGAVLGGFPVNTGPRALPWIDGKITYPRF